MTEMKPNKVREEQLTGLTGRDVQPVDTQPLTVKNAHRAAMIRKKGSTAPLLPSTSGKSTMAWQTSCIF